MIKLISWAAMILCMGMIFNLSSQVAEQSNKLSTRFTKMVFKVLEKVAPRTNYNIGRLNHIVRKNAHFFTYFILGILVLNVLRKSGVQGYKSIILAAAICVIYAVSDEIHQLFVRGRGAQVRDVFIDSTGASVGIGVFLFINRLL